MEGSIATSVVIGLVAVVGFAALKQWLTKKLPSTGFILITGGTCIENKN